MGFGIERSLGSIEALALVEVGLEPVTGVGAGLDLAQGLVPLALQRLIARADAVEFEPQRRVLDGGIGHEGDCFLDVAPQQDRRARAGSEEVALVIEPELLDLAVEISQLVFDIRCLRGNVGTSPQAPMNRCTFPAP